LVDTDEGDRHLSEKEGTLWQLLLSPDVKIILDSEIIPEDLNGNTKC
jgi:hypothetical protein